MNELTFSDNVDERRYEARLGDDLAGYVEFSRLNDDAVVMFSHTEVLPAFEGKGVGSALARHVLDLARTQDKKVIPACEFIAGYIRRHMDYADLVTDNVRRAFKI